MKLYEDQKTINEEVLYSYRVQDLMTAGPLSFIGKFDKQHDNLFVATGFNKFGMTKGALSSMVIRNLIIWNDNDYKKSPRPTP